MAETIDKVQNTTTTPHDERLKQLKQLYPECLTEGKVDLEKLKKTLSTEDIQENGDERYRFTWAGKRDAIRLLNIPTEATLKPDHEDSLNFDTSQNLFIEGDNLEVLKLLYKPYFSRIKAIYIDPPYNTGGDFIYPDNYRNPLDTYLQLTGQVDSEGNLQTTNPETSGRYHSAWLSMMYPRLFLARQLLTDDGIIFVSIDDREVYNLRLMLNEIFGEENCLQQVVWQRHGGGGNDSKYFATDHEYILSYAKNLHAIDRLRRPLTEKEKAAFKQKDDYCETRGPYKTSVFEPMRPDNPAEGLRYEIECPDGTMVYKEWGQKETGFLKLKDEDRIVFRKNRNGEWQVEKKIYLNESKRVPRSLLTKVEKNPIGRKQLREIFDSDGIFSNPKPVGLIKHLLQFSTNSDSIVLDFFAGSCTAAQAVLELNQEDNGNRQYIMVQLPEPTPEKSAGRKAGFETIAEIGKERIRRVCSEFSESSGFRVFKLSPSNYETESNSETDESPTLFSSLEDTLDPLREGWDEEDVLYEIILKEGYPLDSAIQPVKELTTNTVFCITAPNKTQSFHVCLDEQLTETDIERLDLSKDSVFICRDIALDDTLAANLALQCRLKTI